MNEMWRLGSGNGIAYVESRPLAIDLVRDGVTRHRALTEAMAVYYTRSGRAFAWQLLFPSSQWDAVALALAPGEGDASGTGVSTEPVAAPVPADDDAAAVGATEPPLPREVRVRQTSAAEPSVVPVTAAPADGTAPRRRASARPGTPREGSAAVTRGAEKTPKAPAPPPSTPEAGPAPAAVEAPPVRARRRAHTAPKPPTPETAIPAAKRAVPRRSDDTAAALVPGAPVAPPRRARPKVEAPEPTPARDGHAPALKRPTPAREQAPVRPKAAPAAPEAAPRRRVPRSLAR